MPDPVEPVWQDVDEEPADELARLERHGLVAAWPLDPVVIVPERDTGHVGGDEPAVGDRNPVGVDWSQSYRNMCVDTRLAISAMWAAASGTKAQTIARARELIAAAKPAQTAQQAPDSAAAPDQPHHPCPCCGGRMIIIETFQRGSTPRYRPTATPITIRIDTS